MPIITHSNKKVFEAFFLLFSVVYTVWLKYALFNEKVGSAIQYINIGMFFLVLVFFVIDSRSLYISEKKSSNRVPKTIQLFWCGWAFTAILAFTTLTGAVHFLPLFYLFFALSSAFIDIKISLPFIILGIAIQYLYLCYFPWEKDVSGFWVFTSMSFVFASVGYFLGRERKERKEVQSRLSNIKEGAQSFFLSTDTVEASTQLLSDETRTKSGENRYVSFEEKITSILQRIKDLMDPYTVVFIKIKDARYYRVIEAFSENDYLRFNEDIPLEEGIVGWIYKYRKEYANPNFRGGFNSLNYYDKNVDIKSFLGVPVFWSNWMFGVLMVDSLQENAFTEESKKLIKHTASQIEEALENAKLLEEKKIENQEMKALLDASEEMVRFITMADNLEGFINQMQVLSKFSIATVVLDDHGVLKIRASRGLKDVDGVELPRESHVAKLFHEQQPYLDIKRYANKDLNYPLLSKEIRISGIDRVILFNLDKSLGVIVLGFKGTGPSEREKMNMGILNRLFSMAISNAILYEKVNVMATTDGLTGLLNHRMFQEEFNKILNSADRYAKQFALVLVDIDFFKKVNDTFGHPIGDLVLKTVAKQIKSTARKVDIVARYGGEEFAIITPEEDKAKALVFAERLRKDIEKMRTCFDFNGETITHSVTVSIGVAGYPDDDRSKSGIIRLADEALYAAKKSGRNRVVAAVRGIT